MREIKLTGDGEIIITEDGISMGEESPQELMGILCNTYQNARKILGLPRGFSFQTAIEIYHDHGMNGLRDAIEEWDG